jgi:serine/threonine-protein kinase
LRGNDNWTPDKFLQALTQAFRSEYPGLFASLNSLVPKLPDVSNYDQFREMIQHLMSEGLSVIGFFDDFDVITKNPDFPLTFFAFMRSMANAYDVAYVTTSSETLQKLCVSKDVEESPFFNIFTNIALKPLSESEVRQWVIEQSSPSGLPLTSEVDWVYAQVGGFPAFVRILCELLWERKQVSGKLKDSDVEEVETAFHEKMRDTLDFIWEAFSERERNLCAHLLTSGEADRHQMPLVREMMRRGYVRETDGGYALFGKSFERFVSEKTGVKMPQERPKKRRWWPFGR